jgi:hypothetical protein
MSNTDFDHFISLSKPFICYSELALKFLKITNKFLQTFNQKEIPAHMVLKNQINFTFNFISCLFSNTGKTFAIHNSKICKSYFFLYQCKISIFMPFLSLQAEWGTFKNSFFLRYVTSHTQFTPIAQHWGDLIFDAFHPDNNKFRIYPFDKSHLSDCLFINTQFRIDNSARERFSKSKFIMEFAQMIFDKMNIYSNLKNFMNEYLPPESCSNNLLLSLFYQKNIRCKILK